MHDAVRDVYVLPWLRRGSGHRDQIGDGYQIDGGARVVGIEATIAIDFEVVAIDLRREGLGGDSPEAGLAFFHGNGFVDAVEGERNTGGRGIFVRESDAVVLMNFGRAEMR